MAVTPSDLLALIAAQGYACPYTGAELLPDATTQLDHKIPVSRGGTGDIANLQWVRRDVNLAKHDLTHDEFIALCTAIASRAAASPAPPAAVPPVRVAAGHRKPDVARRAALASALASGLNVSEAARASGYRREHVYRLLSDKAFAAEVSAARSA